MKNHLFHQLQLKNESNSKITLKLHYGVLKDFIIEDGEPWMVVKNLRENYHESNFYIELEKLIEQNYEEEITINPRSKHAFTKIADENGISINLRKLYEKKPYFQDNTTFGVELISFDFDYNSYANDDNDAGTLTTDLKRSFVSFEEFPFASLVV